MADVLPCAEGPAGDVRRSDTTQKFILVADVGSTTVRCHIYNKAAQVVAQAEEQVSRAILQTKYR